MALTINLVNNAAAADEFAGAVKMDEVLATAIQTEDVQLLRIVNLVTKNAAHASWTNKENIMAIGTSSDSPYSTTTQTDRHSGRQADKLTD